MFLSGSDCETDIPGCEDSPCQSRRACADVPADDQAADTGNHFAFTCGPCPEGFTEDGRDKCRGEFVNSISLLLLACRYWDVTY
jgi:hypothetical protein